MIMDMDDYGEKERERDGVSYICYIRCRIIFTQCPLSARLHLHNYIDCLLIIPCTQYGKHIVKFGTGDGVYFSFWER